jgi:hypothetical protein
MFGRKSTYDADIAELAAANLTLGRWQREDEERANKAEETAEALRHEIESLRESSYGADRTAAMYKKLYEGATKGLGEIAKQETATANATVKRMARMARAELPVLHHDADGGSGFIQPKANGAAVGVSTAV